MVSLVFTLQLIYIIKSIRTAMTFCLLYLILSTLSFFRDFIVKNIYLFCPAQNMFSNLLCKKGLSCKSQRDGQLKLSFRCVGFETASAVCQLECNWIWERIISTMKVESFITITFQTRSLIEI